MDGDKFDRLTLLLAHGQTRRRFLRGVAGSLGGVVALFGRRTGEAAPSTCAVACAGLPGAQKAACTQACRKCRGDVDRLCFEFGPFGPINFTCCPVGTLCDQAAGECVEVTTCPSGEPAENCNLGIFTDCGEGGACALVDDADSGGCNCVERECTFIPCTTDADCTDGMVCSTIPGCCEESSFCAIPCGSATTLTTTKGWGP